MLKEHTKAAAGDAPIGIIFAVLKGSGRLPKIVYFVAVLIMAIKQRQAAVA
jgi:hypothetical protein